MSRIDVLDMRLDDGKITPNEKKQLEFFKEELISVLKVMGVDYEAYAKKKAAGKKQMLY
jgi:hypothetical protein